MPNLLWEVKGVGKIEEKCCRISNNHQQYKRNKSKVFCLLNKTYEYICN